MNAPPPIRPAAHLAAYRRDAALRSPNADAAIRRILVVGRLGAALGLDAVSGVVWVAGADHGADGVVMPPGQVHLDVWGGRPHEVFAAVAANAPAHVVVTVRWRHPTAWRRLLGWLRWRAFLAFGDARGDL